MPLEGHFMPLGPCVSGRHRAWRGGLEAFERLLPSPWLPSVDRLEWPIERSGEPGPHESRHPTKYGVYSR